MKQTIEVQRHSLAHIMASAIQQLWPEAKFGIGPIVENGYYYDVEIPETVLTDTDLKKIEKQMYSIINKKTDFIKIEKSIDEAIEYFQSINQIYKVELLNELKSKGTTKLDSAEQEVMPEGSSNITIYKTGEFTDLCRGPHISNTSEIDSAFQLHKLAGAYWRGKEGNAMLTRIYGLVFANETELSEYLKSLEQAKARDHRQLGKTLDLFHIDEIVGSGLPLWHPHGALLWRIIEEFWYKEHLKSDYKLVRSPHIGNRILWETSGHWGFYNSSMYPPLDVGQTLAERQNNQTVEKSEEFLLKPMNCPFHIQIYKHQPRSYRDLPIRYAECGTVYRYEKTGELSGLTRVRGFTQDDAHIICRQSQVKDELKRVVNFILFIYKSFGFNQNQVEVFLSLRNPNEKNNFSGTDEGWNFSESSLREVAQEMKLNFKEELGEAAFYGPKLDFKIKDALGRLWQCSTLQFDFNLPINFSMEYVNEQGVKETPFMLHRALFGSYERFIGLLIEHFGGAFPLWLSPVQIAVISVGENHHDYCRQLNAKLVDNGLRAEMFLDNETLGNKIRKAAGQKIPYTIVIGDKEVGGEDLNVRVRGQEQAWTGSVEDFISYCQKLVKEKALEL